MADTFVTSYCNFPHVLFTGRPVDHECHVLPPRALAAERAGDLDLANQILSTARLRESRPVRGRRLPVVFNLSDNRYDKPVKYLKRHRAYLTILQDPTPRLPGMYDVTPEGGDRALPKGIVEKARKDRLHHAFLYQPGHAGRADLVRRLGEYASLDEAVSAILEAP